MFSLLKQVIGNDVSSVISSSSAWAPQPAEAVYSPTPNPEERPDGRHRFPVRLDRPRPRAAGPFPSTHESHPRGRRPPTRRGPGAAPSSAPSEPQAGSPQHLRCLTSPSSAPLATTYSTSARPRKPGAPMPTCPPTPTRWARS
ncbi:hypothetical protein GMYAFLOJ_CDS0069 [Microbacterium phage phiMiGM15]